jgi:hypothetical protein
MFQRIRRLTLVATLLATTGGTLAHAGPSSGSTSPSSVNNQDLFYDYELWLAWDVGRYHVVAKFDDGHTETYRFTSQQAAQNFIAWLAFHIDDFVSARIEQHLELGPWTYYATYDTKAEADGMAAMAVSLGFYADVVPVSISKPLRRR